MSLKCHFLWNCDISCNIPRKSVRLCRLCYKSSEQ